RGFRNDTTLRRALFRDFSKRNLEMTGRSLRILWTRDSSRRSFGMTPGEFAEARILWCQLGLMSPGFGSSAFTVVALALSSFSFIAFLKFLFLMTRPPP